MPTYQQKIELMKIFLQVFKIIGPILLNSFGRLKVLEDQKTYEGVNGFYSNLHSR